MELVYFLGRFHVLILHLPLGILSLAIVVEVLARFRAFRSLGTTAPLLWGAGAVSAVATVVLGFMHAAEPGFQGSPGVELHRWAGVALAAASCLVALLRLRPHLARFGVQVPEALAARAALAGIVAVGLLMMATGHLGGNLTHGEAYLVEYAPGPLRRLAGVADETPRPKPAAFASADLYLDVVEPALSRRCSLCHNDSKTSGRLSLASYDKLMKGGEAGPVIVPGAPDKSDLVRRIELAEDHKEFMPQDGKTPLTADEVAAVRAWVAAGALASAPMAGLKLDAKAEGVLRRLLGFGGEDGAPEAQAKTQAGENDDLPAAPPASPQALAALEAAGFVVRPIAKGSNLLDVDYTGIAPASAAQLDLLGPIAPQVLRLNLRNADIDDLSLARLAPMHNLRRLRLEGAAVSDAGMGQLVALKELRYLNLVRTRVSDAGLARLADLPHLRELYVWGSAATRRGVEQLKRRRPDLLVDDGRAPFVRP